MAWASATRWVTSIACAFALSDAQRVHSLESFSDSAGTNIARHLGEAGVELYGFLHAQIIIEIGLLR